MNFHHHSSLGVTNFKAAVEFYTETLKILAPKIMPITQEYPSYYTRFCLFMDPVTSTGLQITDMQYMLSQRPPIYASLPSSIGYHVAFSAPTRSAVDQWYAKALELGATSNDSYGHLGAPGVRPYTLWNNEEYYAAFVIDPDGYHLEACVIGNLKK